MGLAGGWRRDGRKVDGMDQRMAGGLGDRRRVGGFTVRNGQGHDQPRPCLDPGVADAGTATVSAAITGGSEGEGSLAR